MSIIKVIALPWEFTRVGIINLEKITSFCLYFSEMKMSSRFLQVDYSFRSEWCIFNFSKKHPITEKIRNDFL